MSAFPIAESAAAALRAEGPLARTAEAAGRLAGGLVFLATEEAGGGYPSIEAAEEALGELYGDGRFELIWRDDAWRVVVRYWRPAPPAPVGRTAAAAMRSPIKSAQTPEEARAILGVAAELAEESLGRPFAVRARAEARAKRLLKDGHAHIIERDGEFILMLSFWRPVHRAAALAPGERAELEARAAAPMRGVEPQADPFIGLFERLAPENPAIVLAEEGDGRARGE